jgi:hypothetical protein
MQNKIQVIQEDNRIKVQTKPNKIKVKVVKK